MTDELKEKKERAEKIGRIEHIKILLEEFGKPMRTDRIACLDSLDSEDLAQLEAKLRSANTRRDRRDMTVEAIFNSNEKRREEEGHDDGIDGGQANVSWP